jgi:hypothetical protein
MSEQAGARIGQIRVGVGLAQGLALYALYKSNGFNQVFMTAQTAKPWAAHAPWLFAALTLAILSAPVVLVAGMGVLRRTTLIAWTLAAGLVSAGLAAYDLLRDTGGHLRYAPGFLVFLAIGVGLFIAHSLIVSSAAGGRWVAPYPTRFDVAWKHGVQLVLSIAFTGAFWLVIALGVGLFLLIGLKGFGEFVVKPWIALPATFAVFAAAVHLTDVQAGLTKGIRGVALTLLSWLMPLMGLIAAAFLAALPFTGLKPLWNLTHSTGVLLTAVAVLIVLINAAYQGGEADTRAPLILRWLGRLTALTLLPLTVIAAYGLWLRIGAHGLTPERIIVLTATLIAVLYAVGYAVAAVLPGVWMKALEPTNVAAAYAILAAILLLYSPIGDPARLAVADQVGRLNAGQIAPEAFDYHFLHYKAGDYGRAALKALAAKTSGPNAAAIAAAAKTALATDNEFLARGMIPPPPSPPTHDQFDVYPKGAQLPADFLSKPLTGLYGAPVDCSGTTRCEAYVVQLGGQSAVIVDERTINRLLYMRGPDGVWRVQGQLAPADCPGAADAQVEDLRAGRVAALAPRLNDIAIAGRRYQVQPILDCAATTR